MKYLITGSVEREESQALEQEGGREAEMHEM